MEKGMAEAYWRAGEITPTSTPITKDELAAMIAAWEGFEGDGSEFLMQWSRYFNNREKVIDDKFKPRPSKVRPINPDWEPVWR